MIADDVKQRIEQMRKTMDRVERTLNTALLGCVKGLAATNEHGVPWHEISKSSMQSASALFRDMMLSASVCVSKLAALDEHHHD